MSKENKEFRKDALKEEVKPVETAAKKLTDEQMAEVAGGCQRLVIREGMRVEVGKARCDLKARVVFISDDQ